MSMAVLRLTPPQRHERPAERRSDRLGRIDGRDLAMQFAGKTGNVTALDKLYIHIAPG